MSISKRKSFTKVSFQRSQHIPKKLYGALKHIALDAMGRTAAEKCSAKKSAIPHWRRSKR